MSIKLFPLIEDITLTEYAANTAAEPYKAIVIDPKYNEFKVVSGMYSDKKDCYTQLTNRGFICRKVFERRVFDWIEENADNNLDAYLMFSTAVSKWQGNNMLSKYYEKILKDIPVMNRETQKGNPNSKATEESVLQEDEAFDWKSKLKAASDKALNKIQSRQEVEAKQAKEGKAFHTYLAEKKVLDKMAEGLPKEAGLAELEYKKSKLLDREDIVTPVKITLGQEQKDNIKAQILAQVNKSDKALLADTKHLVEEYNLGKPFDFVLNALLGNARPYLKSFPELNIYLDNGDFIGTTSSGIKFDGQKYSLKPNKETGDLETQELNLKVRNGELLKDEQKIGFATLANKYAPEKVGMLSPNLISALKDSIAVYDKRLSDEELPQDKIVVYPFDFKDEKARLDHKKEELSLEKSNLEANLKEIDSRDVITPEDRARKNREHDLVFNKLLNFSTKEKNLDKFYTIEKELFDPKKDATPEFLMVLYKTNGLESHISNKFKDIVYSYASTYLTLANKKYTALLVSKEQFDRFMSQLEQGVFNREYDKILGDRNTALDKHNTENQNITKIISRFNAVRENMPEAFLSLVRLYQTPFYTTHKITKVSDNIQDQIDLIDSYLEKTKEVVKLFIDYLNVYEGLHKNSSNIVEFLKELYFQYLDAINNKQYRVITGLRKELNDFNSKTPNNFEKIEPTLFSPHRDLYESLFEDTLTTGDSVKEVLEKAGFSGKALNALVDCLNGDGISGYEQLMDLAPNKKYYKPLAELYGSDGKSKPGFDENLYYRINKAFGEGGKYEASVSILQFMDNGEYDILADTTIPNIHFSDYNLNYNANAEYFLDNPMFWSRCYNFFASRVNGEILKTFPASVFKLGITLYANNSTSGQNITKDVIKTIGVPARKPIPNGVILTHTNKSSVEGIELDGNLYITLSADYIHNRAVDLSSMTAEGVSAKYLYVQSPYTDERGATYRNIKTAPGISKIDTGMEQKLSPSQLRAYQYNVSKSDPVRGEELRKMNLDSQKKWVPSENNRYAQALASIYGGALTIIGEIVDRFSNLPINRLKNEYPDKVFKYRKGKVNKTVFTLNGYAFQEAKQIILPLLQKYSDQVETKWEKALQVETNPKAKTSSQTTELEKLRKEEEDIQNELERMANDGSQAGTIARVNRELEKVQAKIKELETAKEQDVSESAVLLETEVHDTLNQMLFDDMVLKPEIRTSLLKIADVFKTELDLKNIDPVDVYLTGSNASYLYTNKSDIDLHLVYDYEQVGIAANILDKYLQAAKHNFNIKHQNLKIKGIPVEVGCEHTGSNLVTSGIYSLRNDEWVKVPQKPETSDVDVQTVDLEQEIQNTLDNDSTSIRELLKKLSSRRKEGLAQSGELSSKNLEFKKLRDNGWISKLRDAYNKALDTELSIESCKENK